MGLVEDLGAKVNKFSYLNEYIIFLAHLSRRLRGELIV